MPSNLEEQLKRQGISLQEYTRQIKCLQKGLAYSNIHSSCSPNNGLIVLRDEKIKQLLEFSDQIRDNIESLLFIPASGAASRMFKHLYQYSEDKSNPLILEFKEKIQSFAFYDAVNSHFSKLNRELEKDIENNLWELIIDEILTGMSYGQLPKGLIPFHGYKEFARTAFQEQVYEGLKYLNVENSKIHFTVPEKSKTLIQDHLNSTFNSSKINFEYSIQKKETDTISLDKNGESLTDDKGNLVFRPGGHGSLIHNLNDLDADLIFIKNIDNIVPEPKNEDSVKWKKVLGAFAVEMKRQIDKLVLEIRSSKDVDFESYSELFDTLNIDSSFRDDSSKLLEILDRPFRVCGMVKNQGEPGGGPFWVKDDQDNISKQIIEKSQIDLSNNAQVEHLKSATHFNPVDLVCCIRNAQGETYNLSDFIDYNASFVSSKSIGSRTVSALEHPGLWNGAMAFWNTVFIEVPLTTFNPVKTVNDLLRPMHQIL